MWVGRKGSLFLMQIMINKSRVMARVWEGGYIAKNWYKWDSNSCSQYKSVQILVITVYRKGWGGKRLCIPCCFSLPNCHQLPYPSALRAQPLQPLLPPPWSDFTMGCLFPGKPFSLCPTTCTLVWLHKKVLHIFATRAPCLSQAHQPPTPPLRVEAHSLQSPLLSSSRLLCSSLNAPLKMSFAVLSTKIWTATRKWYLQLAVLISVASFALLFDHPCPSSAQLLLNGTRKSL